VRSQMFAGLQHIHVWSTQGQRAPAKLRVQAGAASADKTSTPIAPRNSMTAEEL